MEFVDAEKCTCIQYRCIISFANFNEIVGLFSAQGEKNDQSTEYA